MYCLENVVPVANFHKNKDIKFKELPCIHQPTLQEVMDFAAEQLLGQS